MALPADPTEKVYSPGEPRRGTNVSARDPSASPSTCALDDRRRGVHGGQVLPQQSRLVASGANVVDPKRPAGGHRQRQGGAQDLPAAFALRAVDRDHRVRHYALTYP